MSDFYGYRRAARKRLKATETYVPSTECSPDPTHWLTSRPTAEI
jgi:hypothetical protein